MISKRNSYKFIFEVWHESSVGLLHNVRVQKVAHVTVVTIEYFYCPYFEKQWKDAYEITLQSVCLP
jgi:hypothetical protein